MSCVYDWSLDSASAWSSFRLGLCRTLVAVLIYETMLITPSSCVVASVSLCFLFAAGFCGFLRPCCAFATHLTVNYCELNTLF